MPLLSFRLLLLLLFRRHGGIDFQHALGKIHEHLPARHVHGFQIRFGEGHIELLACFAGHDQQRRFASPKLNVLYAADIAAVVENYASDKIADIRPTLLKFGALTAWHLQFRSDQGLGVGDRIDAPELEDQQPLMGPQAFNFEFPPRFLRPAQSQQLHPRCESFRDIAMHLHRNLAVPALGFHD